MPASFFKLNIPNWLSYIFTFTGITGLTGVVLLYVYQCKLIYPAAFPEGSRQEVAKPSQYGMNFIEKELTTKDNVILKSYLIIQPDEEEAKSAPTILYFHANAGNMGHRLPIAKTFYEMFKCNVVMLSYRGYGKSEGTPSEKGLKIDSQTMLDFVREHPILKHTPLIAYGQSIGGAVAIDLVSRNEDSFAGLVIENTFLSLHKVIPNVMPFLKHFTFLCHQEWPSEKSIKHIVNTPILFLAGQKDEIIPHSHMVELHELSETRARKSWVPFTNGFHNNTCVQHGYFEAIRDFLNTYILNGDEEKDEETVQKDKKVVYESYVDGKPTMDGKRNSYQLVSGVADEAGITHSFQVEEVELEED